MLSIRSLLSVSAFVVLLADVGQARTSAFQSSAAPPAVRNAAYDPPLGYYDAAWGLQGTQLKAALHQIIRGHVAYPYTASSIDTWDILKDADRDPNNTNNVLLVYNGASVDAAQEYNNGFGWNREHVWPQSLGGFNTSTGPGTDAHNLRACNEAVNSRRSNLEFDYGGSPVTIEGLTGTYADGNSFEPNDSFKGDLARIIFYMAVRYEGGGTEPNLEVDDFTNGGVGTFGKLSALLEWHLLDPVDEFERRRNSRIYFYQGNRNPFIDRPELVYTVFAPNYPLFFVASPAVSTTTDGATFTYTGSMGAMLANGLSWSNRASGLTGSVPYSPQWSATIPMSMGINTVDFRASYLVTNTSSRAADSPTNSAYASGWFHQSNGGEGFGPWALRSDWGFAGHILFGPGVFNVPSSYGGAFSLWASGNGVTTARRDFSRTLTTHDTFRLQFDNNWIDWNKSVGFALADNTGAKRLDFFFVGGESHYRVADASGVRTTQIGYTDQGQDISVQFTTNNGYLLTSGTNVITGTLANGGEVSSLIASNNGSGAGTEFDMYLGGMSVEDSSGVWASDHPTNSAYGGVWTNGSQSGIGFAPWQVTSVAPNGWAGQARFDTNVWNVTPAFGGAFVLWGSGGGYSEARRAFPQAMTNSETFVLQFDNNLVEQGKLVGFSLADASGTDRVTFLCYGGQQVYWVADSADARATAIPMTQSGIEVRVALTGSNSYRLSAGTNVVEGTLAAGDALSQLRAFNYGSGPATDYDFYLGGMRIETPVVSSQEAGATAMQVVRVDPAATTDGLPNSWWIQYFGTIEGVSAAADSDGDGFSNAQEHVLGTDPKNFASALRTEMPMISSGQVTISWNAVQGKTYQVKGTTNLATTNWPTLGTNIVAPVTGKQTWTHSTGSTQHFYRVELVQ